MKKHSVVLNDKVKQSEDAQASDMSQLLVCPFCGSEASRYEYFSTAIVNEEEKRNGGSMRYMTYCSSKSEIGCPATNTRSFDSRQEADNAWNMGRGKAH